MDKTAETQGNDILKKSHFRDIILRVEYQSKEDYMAVTYKRLFHLLIDRGIQASELTEKAGFSANILTRIRRNQYVSLESIERICTVLGCNVDDILEFIDVEDEHETQ